MKKIIITIGKVKDKAFAEKIDYYYKRTKDVSLIQLKETTSEEELIKKLEPYSFVFALSEEGVQWTSRQFSDQLESLSDNIQEIVFVIGGPDGFDKPITFANKVFSLSKMTFTHEMCLLFLIEQLYRAEQIANNSPYHRD